MNLQAQKEELLIMHVLCRWTTEQSGLEQASPSDPLPSATTTLVHLCQPYTGLPLPK